MLDIAFEPHRSGAPLYRQLSAHLRELIESRRLTAADRLPPSRELAASLGLSRNTVNQAYQELVDSGLARAHVGRGTFVAAGAGAAADASEPEAERGLAWGGLLARRARSLTLPGGLLSEAGATAGRFDFRGGQTDVSGIPRADLRRAFARATDQLGQLAQDRDPRGLPQLREAVAHGLVARGIHCTGDDVLIVNGAQQALDLIARVLVDPGDTVALEQPGYFGASLAFSHAEAHLVGVGVDAGGIRTDELARLLRARRLKLLFTTPAVQSPTGVVLAAERRGELLELADAYQLPIVEDDYDSELRYGVPATPALKNHDPAGRVVYLGTFSKALFTGLRLGYVVAPRPLRLRLALARFAGDFQSDVLTQAAVADLLRSGALERHVRRARRVYAGRREALLTAIGQHLPDAEVSPPAGGTAVWLTLPGSIDVPALHAAAAERGVLVSRGDAFHFDGRGEQNLFLSFAALAPEEIEEGVAELGRLARRRTRRQKR